MAEALTTGLAQISALSVVGRTSAMRYQGTKKSTPEVAGELHVDAVVTGSVQRSGDRVLVAAQLIDGKTSHLLWAKSYEHDLRDVLTLENQIAQTIAQEIEIKLTSQETAELAAIHQVNPEAQEAYFKARYWFRKRDYKQYFDYAKQATEKDPGYAAAWAALADSYGLRGYTAVCLKRRRSQDGKMRQHKR